MDFPDGFMDRIPVIHGNNNGKWRTGFSDEQPRRIGPIISDSLITLGYEPDQRQHQDL